MKSQYGRYSNPFKSPGGVILDLVNILQTPVPVPPCATMCHDVP